jgi:nicotinate-nucleotide adenylyltransferase
MGRRVELSAATRRPLGVMGGTFDPIHLGHLAVAEHTRELLDLAAVVFVVAADPPHKRDLAVSPAEHRLAMVELAIVGNPWFRVSRMELDRPGPSWSVDTLAELAARADAEGRERPVFILSAEALAGFPTWREPERILDLCRVAVVPRADVPPPSPARLRERFPGREDRFLLLDRPHQGHSSTDLRARVRAGRSIRYLVPAAVAAYIGEHHLYQPATTPEPLARSRP